jgi:hypothetical protein
MELLNGMPTMGIINQLLQRRRGGQVAPIDIIGNSIYAGKSVYSVYA